MLSTINKLGLTFIELTMVIVIIGMLAVIILPIIINLQTTAREKVDYSIINALQIQLKLDHLEKTINGEVATVSVNFFDSLVNPPPYEIHQWADVWEPNTQDNVTWRVVVPRQQLYFYICCPHFSGGYRALGTPFYFGEKSAGKAWILNFPLHGSAGNIQSLIDYPCSP